MTGFNPTWYSPPGGTIRDVLWQRHWSVSEFAQRMQLGMERAAHLVQGLVPIDDTLAIQLSEVIGGSVEFWRNREQQYLTQVRRDPDQALDNWLATVPVKDLIEFGWLPKQLDKREGLLRYFGIVSEGDWQNRYHSVASTHAFRKSSAFSTKEGALAAWLRRGEVLAESYSLRAWNKSHFYEAVLRSKYLTRKKNPEDFVPELRELCAACGVALVIVRAPRGCAVSGAARLIDSDRALIQLSFRHLTDDQFWFTFFHEAAHLILHSTRRLFLDTQQNDEMYHVDQEELEANAFASEVIVPHSATESLERLRITPKNVIRFAMEMGVSPGLVVGQLQYSKRIEHSRMNYLKRRFDWDSLQRIP